MRRIVTNEVLSGTLGAIVCVIAPRRFLPALFRLARDGDVQVGRLVGLLCGC